MNGSTTETTIYIGGIFEKLSRSGTVEYKHSVFGPDSVVAIHNRKSTGVNETIYPLQDHLGSTDVVTSSTGATLVKLSYTPFGARRNGNTWSGPPTAADLTAISNTTRRGFTEHEQLDNLDLIHMNGRVYHPVIGRFISADPFVQAPFNTQSLNRYSYVFNSPMSFVDPTGFTRETPEEDESVERFRNFQRRNPGTGGGSTGGGGGGGVRRPPGPQPGPSPQPMPPQPMPPQPDPGMGQQGPVTNMPKAMEEKPAKVFRECFNDCLQRQIGLLGRGIDELTSVFGGDTNFQTGFSESYKEFTETAAVTGILGTLATQQRTKIGIAGGRITQGQVTGTKIGARIGRTLGGTRGLAFGTRLGSAIGKSRAGPGILDTAIGGELL